MYIYPPRSSRTLSDPPRIGRSTVFFSFLPLYIRCIPGCKRGGGLWPKAMGYWKQKDTQYT